MATLSNPHLAALAVLVAAAGGSIWLPRRHPGRWVVVWTRVLGLIILAGWAGEYAVEIRSGIWAAKYYLPLQLTDLISATAVAALWTLQPLLVELVYFWALTAPT